VKATASFNHKPTEPLLETNYFQFQWSNKDNGVIPVTSTMAQTQ